MYVAYVIHIDMYSRYIVHHMIFDFIVIRWHRLRKINMRGFGFFSFSSFYFVFILMLFFLSTEPFHCIVYAVLDVKNVSKHFPRFGSMCVQQVRELFGRKTHLPQSTLKYSKFYARTPTPNTFPSNVHCVCLTKMQRIFQSQIFVNSNDKPHRIVTSNSVN